MRDYEKEIIRDFKNFENVAEQWPVYDSIIICEQMYGSEATVPGWYTSFALFGSRETHSLFKNRTMGTAGEQYCNMQSADSMDFAFLIDSIGLEITGPATNDVQIGSVDGQGEIVGSLDYILPKWWAADFPWHVGVQLKVQQDVRWEGNAMSCPAGVGASGAGLSFQQAAVSSFAEIPWMFSNTTQGISMLKNRQPFPEPIGVPRTGNLEVILHVGEWARTILQNITGPHSASINNDGGVNNFYTRYMIRCSLFGKRLIQQRDQYHR